MSSPATHHGKRGSRPPSKRDNHDAREARRDSRPRGDPREAREAPPRDHSRKSHRPREEHREGHHRDHRDPQRGASDHREPRREPRGDAASSAAGSVRGGGGGAAPRPPASDDQEAWLDTLITDCTDKRSAPVAPAPPRDKIPKRPSSRADSRPTNDYDAASAAAPRGEPSSASKPARPPEQKEAQRPSPAPVLASPAVRTAPRGMPQKEVPLSELHSDEEIESEEPGKVAKAGSAVIAPAAPNGAKSPNTSAHHIEEDIQEHVSPAAEDPKNESINDEIEYDEDFEEADDDDEDEYQPQVKLKAPSPPSTAPEPEKPANKVSIQAEAGRAPSPGVVTASNDANAMADIKKAMENEKIKAQSVNPTVPTSDPGSQKKGFLATYESTMPKFNLVDGSKPHERAAQQRLKDLKRLKVLDKLSTEKIDLFKQRPQNSHNLFLAGKSLKFCNLRSVSCQTGDDDVDTGCQTDEVWTDEKEMQFPTLTMGQSTKSGGEAFQMLPFLRRALPLFEASMAELQQRQATIAAPEQPKSRLRFGLPESFVKRCIGSRINIADVAVCPEWYGANHALVLYTWPWDRRALPAGGSTIDTFVRPLQSLMGLYPIIASCASPSNSPDSRMNRPARCLYSFCRLSSIMVVNDRPHLIVAGSEMGSLLVWDLRGKPHVPAEHFSRNDDASAESRDADADVAYFQGPLWLDSAYSTDLHAFSATQGGERDEGDPFDDDMHGAASHKALDVGVGVHSVEICCVRCSQGASGDALIFALDLTGTVSFWRVIELASAHTTQVKLALQGSVVLASAGGGIGARSLCNFLDASYLCIHPQQQMHFIVLSTAGVLQAHRHRHSTLASDGPHTLELLVRADEADEEIFGRTMQPCSADFNPFTPNLLLVAYAEGDLALFDCSICVPITHWSSSVARTGDVQLISVKWSPCRPCVFFVKAGSSLEVWDLAERSYGPVDTIDLASASSAPAKAEGAVCNELYVSKNGQPVAVYNDSVFVLNLAQSMILPLQTKPLNSKIQQQGMTVSKLVLPCGAAMQYAERPGKDASLVPLVLVHGYLDCWRSWSLVMERLASTGRRVVSLTMRGWDDSDKTGEYTVDAYAEDVVGVFDALSISTAVLAGHSMGTLISTAVAARHPKRIEKLVLCSAVPTWEPGFVVDALDGRTFSAIGDMLAGWVDGASVDRAFLEAFQLDELKQHIADGRLEASFADQVMNWTLKADVRAYREAWRSMLDEDHTNELGAIAVPTLIIWGTADTTVVEKDQLKLVAALGVKATLVKVDGAQRAMIWTHSDQVAKLIDEFLVEDLRDEVPLDKLLVDSCEQAAVFPTLERHRRKIDVPQHCAMEQKVLSKVLARIHPLQAWT